MTEDAKRADDKSAAQKDRVEEQQNKTAEETEATQSETEITSGEETSSETTAQDEIKKDDVEATEGSEASADVAESTEADDEQSDETESASESKSDTTDDADDTKEHEVEQIEIEIEADDAKTTHEDFQTDVREQIENCKFEIIAALQESVHQELEEVTERQVRKIERRRRSGVIVRNIVILILAVVVGFFAYCLYDAQYFDFLRPNCENNTCNETSKTEDMKPDSEIVKDTAWYQKNYSYLLDSLQLKLDADKLGAYYLYTGDYKVDEIQPEYLLGMAYNRLDASVSYDSTNGIAVPAKDLRAAFINLFGSADNFTKRNFTYHCANFTYDKTNDWFTTPSLLCADTANREIMEMVDEIYEEGSAMYFLTTAAVYDRAEESFYNFDNLFKPVAQNVTRDDFEKQKSLLNKYQYQFKKVDGKYYFSGVMKLK